MAAPPPGRFSVTTVTPLLLPTCSPSRRARMSALPPDGNGTTTLMLRCDHAAGLKESRPSATALAARSMDRRDSVRGRVMKSSPASSLHGISASPAGSSQQMLARMLTYLPMRLEESVRLFGLDAGPFDHLAPFFGLGGDVGAEFRRRIEQRRGGDLPVSPFDRGAGEPGVDLAVEPFDDLGRRAARDADAAPGIGLVAGDGFADRRHVRQEFRPRLAADPERTHPAGANLRKR